MVICTFNSFFICFESEFGLRRESITPTHFASLVANEFPPMLLSMNGIKIVPFFLALCFGHLIVGVLDLCKVQSNLVHQSKMSLS
jgi:hypothetical protein